MAGSVEDAPHRILVVDDDLELRDMLRRYLGEHRFDVQVLASADRLDERLRREPFDVLILDLMMPGEDGLSICRRLRAEGSTVPILMLTARGAAVDRILGLEMGADDYLAKPFDPRELIARLHSILRRQSMVNGDGRWAGGNVIRFGPFTLNLTRMEVTRGGEVLALSSSEFQLLRVMATHAGMTTDAFTKTVKDWFATARHPRFDRPYNEITFLPMRELLDYLRANGFKTYIVSGGGIEFMRPMTEQMYGIPPEQVVGSSIATKYELDGDAPVLIVTHKTTPDAIDFAIGALPRTGVIVGEPVELRIEEV